MRHRLSPFRIVFEAALNLVGRGPRRSPFTPARDPKSRLRFAQYVSRVQPAPDPTAVRHTARLLGTGGALSRGVVRHAPWSAGLPTPAFRTAPARYGQPGRVAARRRAQAGFPVFSLRMLLDALRAR